MQKRKRKTRRLVGFVPNETDLDPWLTIEQNIRFSALLYNVSDHDYRSRLQSFSKILGIEDFCMKYPQMSHMEFRKEQCLLEH